jgi:hypothetical protein
MSSPLTSLREHYEELYRVTALLERSAREECDAEVLRSLLADRQSLFARSSVVLQAARPWIAALPTESSATVAAAAEIAETVELGQRIAALNRTLEEQVRARLAELREQSTTLDRSKRTLHTYRPVCESEACAVMDRLG